MDNSNKQNDFPNFEEFVSSFKNNVDAFSHNDNTSQFDADNNNSNPFGNFDMNTFIKMKQIMEKMNEKKNDPRSTLLLSLKPYLKPARKQKVDQYIQIFNMSNIMDSFKPMGGDNKK